MLIRTAHLAAICLATAPVARAAEVVWLSEPSVEDAARIAVLAQAKRGPLTPATFRSGAVVGIDDADSKMNALIDALTRVRVHESVLDGELLILDGLQKPLSEVTFVQGRQDRDTLIRALLYQGFAADRFWGGTLATDPAARPWRIQVDGTWVEQPWLDAFALDPLRVVTDSDIAEAPQREAYAALRRTLAQATRATVLAPDLPRGATLYVDGEPQDMDETTVLELLPGRHWFHVEQDGVPLTAQAVRLDPAQRFEVQLDIPQEDWRTFLKVLRDGHGLVPSTLKPALNAMDDEVWFAEGAGASIEVWAVKPDGATPVKVPSPATVAQDGGALGNVALAAWVGPSHLHSPDFRAQDPASVPDGPGVINAIAPTGGLSLTWDRDWLRYGLGFDVTLPLGSHHVALSGPARYRARPYTYAILGHPLVQATFGLYAPYHLAGGVQATVPLVEDWIEVRGGLRVGGAPPQELSNGDVWRGKVLIQSGVAIGIRLRPGRSPSTATP